jgi:hypothetical protein
MPRPTRITINVTDQLLTELLEADHALKKSRTLGRGPLTDFKGLVVAVAAALSRRQVPPRRLEQTPNRAGESHTWGPNEQMWVWHQDCLCELCAAETHRIAEQQQALALPV